MRHFDLRRIPLRQILLQQLFVGFSVVMPQLAMAQSSPFMTGATALQSNLLAWLTPIAIILVMVLGGMAMANRVAQVSSTYGHGDAHTIVENCGNTLILRCSASEGGGTARFASQLIGEREVVQIGVSKTRRFTELFGSTTHSEQLRMEPAVLASQVEQLPDLTGYLKYASEPQWQKIRLDAKRAWHLHRCHQSTIEEIREPSSLERMSPNRSIEEVEHG